MVRFRKERIKCYSSLYLITYMADGHSHSRQYTFSNYILDIHSRSIRSGQTQIVMRRKAFEVLVLLFEHRDRVVSKEELLETVWAGVSVSDDVVIGTIRTIRSLLGDDARAQAVVRTVHGVGYQFVAPVEPFDESSAPPPPTAEKRKVLGWIGVAGALGVLILGGAWVSMPHLASLLPSSAPPSEVLWLRLDQPSGVNVTDSSGHGNHARIVNGVQWVPGMHGSALEFDGVSGYLVGNSSGREFPSGDAPRSAVCWLRTTDHEVGDRNLLHWGTPISSPPRLNYHLFLSAGRVGWGNGYGQGLVKTDAEVADGQWHQVAAVFSGPPAETSYIFVDGRQAAAAGPLPADTRVGANWTVGLFMGGGTPYRGALDDLRLFQGALSASSITSLYHCGSSDSAFSAPFAGRPYFVTVGDSELSLGAKEASDTSIPIENHKESFGAVEFASSDGACKYETLRGSPLPAAFRIRMDVEFPSVSDGLAESLCGPFIDAAPMGPRDEIAKASGLWIALGRDGTVSARSLSAPERTVAVSKPHPGDASRGLRHLVLERNAGTLRVRVDGAEAMVLNVSSGNGRQAGGIAFRVSGKPLYTAPQRVRNLSIEKL